VSIKPLKPFFKYSGGKRKEIPTVEKLKPKSFNTFYEPFVGAGAIWLHLAHHTNVVNDNYEDVISFYHVMKNDTIRLVKEINRLSANYNKEMASVKRDAKAEQRLTKQQLKLSKLHSSNHSTVKAALKILQGIKKDSEETLIASCKEDTLNDAISKLSSRCNEINDQKIIVKDLKDQVNKEINDIADRYFYYYRDTDFTSDFDKAVSFYLMRQLSFSGMLRFSNEGKFNVPYGWYKSFKGIDQSVSDIQAILNNSIITHGDWKYSVQNATKDDFVFLDPPYTRQFTDYHPAGQFREQDHRELAEWFRNTKSKVMIIINRDELTEELYDDYIVADYNYRYSIQYRDRMTHKDSNANHFVATNNY